MWFSPAPDNSPFASVSVPPAETDSSAPTEFGAALSATVTPMKGMAVAWSVSVVCGDMPATVNVICAVVVAAGSAADGVTVCALVCEADWGAVVPGANWSRTVICLLSTPFTGATLK